MNPGSAAAYGLLVCEACALAQRPAAGGSAGCCVRCGAPLHARRPDALARAWALLLASGLFYVPAYALPIMHSNSLFGAQSDTILSGIAYLWASGSWLVALVIFVASVVVPFAKLAALTLLLGAAQRRSRWRQHERARLYRFVELTGRWSMVDVFVVALLAALLRFPPFAQVTPGPGAFAFCAMVVFSLFAAAAFDPRLTWDAAPAAPQAR